MAEVSKGKLRANLMKFFNEGIFERAGKDVSAVGATIIQEGYSRGSHDAAMEITDAYLEKGEKLSAWDVNKIILKHEGLKDGLMDHQIMAAYAGELIVAELPQLAKESLEMKRGTEGGAAFSGGKQGSYAKDAKAAKIRQSGPREME